MNTHVDYATRVLTAEFDTCVGDPDAHDESAREQRRRGPLTIDGLVLWSLEPAPLPDYGDGGLWLTADGLLQECPTKTGKNLAKQLGTDGVA